MNNDLRRCTFTSNSAGGGGGALLVHVCTLCSCILFIACNAMGLAEAAGEVMCLGLE